MDTDIDLPADRPMPVELQEHLWNRLRPQVAATLTGRRRRSAVLPLSAAAAVGLLVVGGVLVLGQDDAPRRTIPASDPADVQLAHDCVTATVASGVEVPDPGSWTPGVKIDADTGSGNGAAWPEFLMIRNDRAAALCLVAGSSTGGITGADVAAMEGRGRHSYATLTAARPFDYLDAWNFLDGTSIQFGITTEDVVAVSVVWQDGNVTPALLHDGTFAVKIDRGEMCGRPGHISATPVASNVVRVTLGDGQVVEGPLCKPTG
ncbi:hypothetical protein SAMN04488564_117127 [Lentzea waywayandensis]|uniref:Uncharacterized protein n=1 Tax=Lentzea waywayandensis TaxID=84724 RepID=A0A1I6FGX4_9PSEU|nr:hypothetical protein [Lentzea waywayandensis]SFR29203.1 hypothetical protein SAMN04488564_117127 [Lentzea waywayandensis]